MAKMYGITGNLSGKMGSAVFRVRNGQQVVTQYNPVVANPNTKDQQGSRARFKLVSQLAAVFAPSIKSWGANIIKSQTEGVNAAFVKINYPLTSLDPDPTAAEKATIDLASIQLTKSQRPYGTLVPSVNAGSCLVTITSPGASNSGRKGKVALVGFGTMGVVKSPYVISTNEVNFENNDQASIEYVDLPKGDYAVLSFGVDVINTAARLDLGQMQQDTESPDSAMLPIDSMLRDGSASVTATIGASFTID